jgi:hypothetical protein
MILTIAIPTFNRNEILRANVAKLLPQVTADCRLLILDNHSPEPVSEALADLLAAFPHVQVQIIRHRINIGGGANVMRGFELCETPWLWVLGDDDEPVPDAVQTVLDVIRSHPQAVYVNFSYEWFRRDTSFVTRGRSEFIHRMDSYGTCLFISLCLFRVEHLADVYQWGLGYMTCCAPHLVTLLKALGGDGECVFSERQVMNWSCPPAERKWSHLYYSLWGLLITDLPMTHDERRCLVDKILPDMKSIGVALTEVLFMVRQGDIDRGTAMHYIEQIYGRGFRHRRGLSATVRNWGARVLVRFPRLTLKFLDWWYRVRTGMSLTSHPYFQSLPSITAKTR